MSKLRDRIRASMRRRAAPIGFARERPSDAPRRVLVVAEVGDASSASAAVAAGADALLFGGGTDGVAAVVEAADGRPVGARLPAATASETEALREAGVDFVVFDDALTEASALVEDEPGRVLALDPARTSEEELRLLGPLDLDAVLLAAPGGALTVRAQLEARRIAELVRAPLVVPASADMTAATLRVWRDAGGPVVLAPAGDASAVERLVEAAEAVPPPRERREDRPDPLVPAAPVVHYDDFDEE